MSQTTGSVYYDTIILENMTTREAVIGCLANYLLQKGYVNDQYQAETLAREEVYPTGLPTKPIGIAVPHSKAENVIKPAIILGISKEPVAFAEMGNANATVQAGLVFLLALQGENRHLNYLKNIVDFCKQESNLVRLYQASSQQEANKIFQTEILGQL